MKLMFTQSDWIDLVPAAFGRLCVETGVCQRAFVVDCPAAFGRLCVETLNFKKRTKNENPAAFGRLCVETTNAASTATRWPPSRLRAAVC